MHALSLLLVIATAGLSRAAQVDPVTAVKRAFVQFPESFLTNQWTTDRNKINGYTHIAREKCLQLCGKQPGVGNFCHHQIQVIPTRMENVAETACWCCVKDPQGTCYSRSHPYTKDQPFGPWSDMTEQLVAKLAMKTIGCSTVASSAVSQVKPVILELKTENPAPGKTLKLHWNGPKSQVGGTYYAYFIDEQKNVLVRALKNEACTFPPMTGRVAITISAAKDPKASSLYIVARTTVNVPGSSTKRLKRALKSIHGSKRIA